MEYAWDLDLIIQGSRLRLSDLKRWAKIETEEDRSQETDWVSGIKELFEKQLKFGIHMTP